MSCLADLIRCGEIQKELFYSQLFTHNRAGEITCVNDATSGDSIIFERWHICGVEFVAGFRLLSEDSLIVRDIHYSYSSHLALLEEKTQRQKVLYRQFLEKLALEGRSLAQVKKELEESGKDSSLLDFKEYTREMLEERLPSGKKTIQGDRNTNVELMERQSEIPNDLQRPRLNQYFLTISAEIQELISLVTKEGEAETADIITKWRADNLIQPSIALGLSTALPFMKEMIIVIPRIFEFPAKEANF